jgi:hypothetical protein
MYLVIHGGLAIQDRYNKFSQNICTCPGSRGFFIKRLQSRQEFRLTIIIRAIEIFCVKEADK